MISRPAKMLPSERRRSRTQASIAVVATATMFLSSANVCAGEASATLDATHAAILANDLRIMEDGMNLKLAIERRKLWRERRLFFYSLCNSSLTSVGAFMAGAGRLKYANNPSTAPAHLFENATIVRLTANFLSAGGMLIEFGRDRLDGRADKKAGHDAKSTLERVAARDAEVQQLLAQSSAIKEDPLASAYSSESKLLRDLHFAVMEDFTGYYDERRGKSSKRFTQLLLTFSSNMVSAGGSLYSGIIVPHRFTRNAVKRTRHGGAGGITDIITGSTNVLTPAVATVADMAPRYMRSEALLKRQLGAVGADDTSVLESDLRQLESEPKSSALNSNSLSTRAATISAVLKILKAHQKINDDSRKHVLRNLLLATLDSGVDASGSFSKIANGTATTIGAYKHTRDAHRRFLVTGRAGIFYGIGNAFGAEEVVRDEITRELKNHSQKKRGETSVQILQADIDKSIKLRQALSINREQERLEPTVPVK